MESFQEIMEGEDSISDTNSGFMDKLDFDAMAPAQIFEQMVADVMTSTTNNGIDADTERLDALGSLFSNDVEEYALAVMLFKKTLAFDLDFEGETSGAVAGDYDRLGRVLQYQGKCDEALDCFQKSLASSIQFNKKGAESCDAAESYDDIGRVLFDLRRFDEAREHFDKAMAIYRAGYGENDDDVAKQHINIGKVFHAQEEYAKAQECYDKALAILLEDEDGNEAAISDLYMSIGENCRLQRVGLSETMEYYKKSLAITLKLEGQVSEGVAGAYHNMALALREFGGDLDEAMELAQKSLALFMGIVGPDHGDVGIAYQNIAMLLERQKKPTEARDAIEKSVAIAKALHGEEHPTTIVVQRQAERINLFCYIEGVGPKPT